MTKLAAIIDLVGERSPLQKKQLEKTVALLTNNDLAAAERTLSFFTDKMRYSVGDVAEAYLWFVETFMDEQVYFARTGKYRNSTYAEVEPYYTNNQLMKNYVIALALTFYMFPQHIAVNNFYKSILPPPPVSYSKTTACNGISPLTNSYKKQNASISGNWPRSWSSVCCGYGKWRLRQLHGGGHSAVVR